MLLVFLVRFFHSRRFASFAFALVVLIRVNLLPSALIRVPYLYFWP